MDCHTVETVRIRIWRDGTTMFGDLGVLASHEPLVIFQFTDADIHVCGTDPSCRSAAVSLGTLRSEGARMGAGYACGFIDARHVVCRLCMHRHS